MAGSDRVRASKEGRGKMAIRIMSRREALKLGVGGSLGLPVAIGASRAQGPTVYVNSYGGVWETSWKKAFFDPFTA